MVGSLLIGCSVYGNRYTDLPILPSAIACGVVLIFLSLLGLYGAAKHHQVALFFYMIILFCLFIVQFAIACSCLAVNKHQQEVFARQGTKFDFLLSKSELEVDLNLQTRSYHLLVHNHSYFLIGWEEFDDGFRSEIQNKFHCCGFNDTKSLDGACSPCLQQLETTIDSAFRVTGTIGLLFSF